LVFGGEQIADIANRLDERFRAELSAQPPDRDVQDVRARIEVVAPDVREELLAADHVAAPLDELVEQPELAVGEPDPRAVDTGLAPRAVQAERSGSQEGAGRIRSAAQLHSRPCDELIERERLDEI